MLQTVHTFWSSMLRNVRHGATQVAKQPVYQGTEHAPVEPVRTPPTSGEPTYLSPLFMTQSACVYRRTRSTNPQALEHVVRFTRLSSGAKRRDIGAIAWFEVSLGPLVFSLNRLGAGSGDPW